MDEHQDNYDYDHDPRPDQRQYQFRYQVPVDEEGRRLGTGKALWSMILGIFSLVFFAIFLNVLTAIISIVLGITHLTHYTRKQGRAMAIAGIATSLLSIGLLVGGYTAVARNPHFTQMIENQIEGGGSTPEDMQKVFEELYGGEEETEL